MAEIVDIDVFKKRKLVKIEAEWNQYMTRAEQFQKEGKLKFAGEMLAKAKALRVEIDKLRGPPKWPKAPYLKYGNHDKMLNAMTVTTSGFGGSDLGYPKTTPETTPPASA